MAERRLKQRFVISAIVSLGILREEAAKDSLLMVSEMALGATSQGALGSRQGFVIGALGDDLVGLA